MAIDKKVYALSKHYTDETVIGLGALKGASAQIKSIEHRDGQNIVTFLWEATDGSTRESIMRVNDGTPIFTYTVGDTYHYGDIVIYEAAFYRCSVSECIAEEILDVSKFEELNNADHQYDIVENASLLPPRFTPADRKMYYCIDEMCFYLWNGYKWAKQEKKASYTEVGMVKIDEETLEIDENAKISIKVISNNDIQGLFNQV